MRILLGRNRVIGLLLVMMALVSFLPSPVAAQIVLLCKSKYLDVVLAHEGSCKRGETQIERIPDNTQAVEDKALVSSMFSL